MPGARTDCHESAPVRIDFVIVGAAKSATTSLHQYLAQHAKVFMPDAKELAFFLAEPGDETELELMRSSVAARIHRHNSEARAIAILRNPIDRAYSAYWFSRLRGWDQSFSFEAAIEREFRGRLGTDNERLVFSYIEHGHYAGQVEHYQEVLGHDQVAILFTEDLQSDPVGTMRHLLGWLGVSRQSIPTRTI